jgi:hypothetical protein
MFHYHFRRIQEADKESPFSIPNESFNHVSPFGALLEFYINEIRSEEFTINFEHFFEDAPW